jgi:hypothetical protein
MGLIQPYYAVHAWLVVVHNRVTIVTKQATSKQCAVRMNITLMLVRWHASAHSCIQFGPSVTHFAAVG